MNIPTKSTRPCDARFDLGALVGILGTKRPYDKLADLVGVSLTTRSAVMDLNRAHALSEKVGEIGSRTSALPNGERDQNVEDAEMAGALFRGSIIRYARATTDNSRSRRKLRLSEKLQGDDLGTHRRLIALRDTAVAHADKTADFIDGPWSSETLILNEWVGEQVWEIGAYHRDTNYGANMLSDLDKMLPVAMTLIIGIQNDSDQPLLTELRHLSHTERDFAGLRRDVGGKETRSPLRGHAREGPPADGRLLRTLQSR